MRCRKPQCIWVQVSSARCSPIKHVAFEKMSAEVHCRRKRIWEFPHLRLRCVPGLLVAAVETDGFRAASALPSEGKQHVRLTQLRMYLNRIYELWRLKSHWRLKIELNSTYNCSECSCQKHHIPLRIPWKRLFDQFELPFTHVSISTPTVYASSHSRTMIEEEVPTADWTDVEIETLLAEAYSPSFFASFESGISTW